MTLSRTGAVEQHQPVEIFGRGRWIFVTRRDDAEMDIQEAAYQLRAFDVAVQIQKAPAFAVAKRRVGDAAQGLACADG
jgi:hypothetical protein